MNCFKRRSLTCLDERGSRLPNLSLEIDILISELVVSIPKSCESELNHIGSILESKLDDSSFYSNH